MKRELLQRNGGALCWMFFLFYTLPDTLICHRIHRQCVARRRAQMTCLQHCHTTTGEGICSFFIFVLFFFTMVMKKSQLNGIKLYNVLSLSLLCGSQNWIYIFFFLWLVHLHIKCWLENMRPFLCTLFFTSAATTFTGYSVPPRFFFCFPLGTKCKSWRHTHTRTHISL